MGEHNLGLIFLGKAQMGENIGLGWPVWVAQMANVRNLPQQWESTHQSDDRKRVEETV